MNHLTLLLLENIGDRPWGIGVQSAQVKVGSHGLMKKKVAVLGLDVGRKRIGVAGCDGTGLIATAITTIHRRSYQQDIEQLQGLIAERGIDRLVVGLPYTLSGEIGTQAKQVQKLARRWAADLGIPIEYMDERLTSVEAENQLKAQRRFSTYNKGLIDQQAAQIILQQWLDLQRRPSLGDAVDFSHGERATLE